MAGGGQRGVRLLAIEDDPDSLEMVRRLFERNGFQVITARSAAEGLRALYGARPDLVLLDLGLPDVDGRALLRRIREMTDIPVVVVTGRDAEADKVRALRAGADDYVTKPFGFAELLARVEALLRRSLGRDHTRGPYSDGLVDIDYAALDVRIAGQPVRLTALELRLLLAFVENPNQVLSAADLLDKVWGDPSLPRSRVKLYVAYLRDKFREAGVDPPIDTIRGFGYRYRPPPRG